MHKIIEKFIITIFLVLAIIFAIQIILKITGHSPSDVQILYVGFGVIISYLLVMSYKIAIFIGKVDEFMKTTKNSFRKLHEE